MDLSVRSHIARIEREIEALTVQLMNADNRSTANEAEASIRSLRLALSHYETALKIENEVLRARRMAIATSSQGEAAD